MRLLTLLFIMLGLPFAAVANEPDINKLAWVGGCWASDKGETGSGERWTPLAGGTMFGMSRTIKQGKTVAFEFMELAADANGKLALTAHPSGQRKTVFPLLRINETEAVFENPSHDFPQRVVYANDGDKLKARIEGKRNGQERVIDFPMTRMSCEVR
jgi:hypothetical protein